MKDATKAAPALLMDFGGVLTESVMGAFERSCLDHGVDARGFIAEVFSPDHADDSPFALIELGQISLAEFVERISPVLARHAAGDVDSAAWFGEVQKTTRRLDPQMVEAVRTLGQRGVQVALVSNSWGPRDTYPWEGMPQFAAVVVSAEVGIRKPDPDIYLLAANKLGRTPAECVFVDDVEVNLAPARALGMRTILHKDREATLAELRRIYG